MIPPLSQILNALVNPLVEHPEPSLHMQLVISCKVVKTSPHIFGDNLHLSCPYFQDLTNVSGFCTTAMKVHMSLLQDFYVC